MTLFLKPATESDSQAISTLITDCIRRTNIRDYPVDIIELTCGNFTPERISVKISNREFFLALSSDVLVATVSFSGNVLHELFVVPEQQGQGIGQELVKFVEGEANLSGITEIDVHSSLTARDFYARLGFVEVALEQRSDGSTYLMRKTIPTGS